MSKLIIIEGPDECGKTTLATHLARQLECTYVHCTASKKLFPALEDYHLAMVDMVEANRKMGFNGSFVFDRFWPSEVCYGIRLLRPESGYKWEETSKRLTDAGALYIWCFSSGAWHRYREGHRDPAHSLSEVEYRQVYRNYRDLYEEKKAKDLNRHLLYELELDGAPAALTHFTNLVRMYASGAAH